MASKYTRVNCPNCGRSIDPNKPEKGHDNCLISTLVEVLMDRGHEPRSFDITKIDAADIWGRFGGPAADEVARQMQIEAYPGDDDDD